MLFSFSYALVKSIFMLDIFAVYFVIQSNSSLFQTANMHGFINFIKTVVLLLICSAVKDSGFNIHLRNNFHVRNCNFKNVFEHKPKIENTDVISLNLKTFKKHIAFYFVSAKTNE